MQTIRKTRGGFKLQKSAVTKNFPWKFKLVLEPTSVKCETSVFETSFLDVKALATAMLHWAAPRTKSESEQELLIMCLSWPLLCPPTFYTHQISAFFSRANTHTHPVRLLVQQSTVCSKKWSTHRMQVHIKDPIVAEPMTQACQMSILTGKICKQFLNSWLSILRGSTHGIHRKIFLKGTWILFYTRHWMNTRLLFFLFEGFQGFHMGISTSRFLKF